MHFQLWSHFFQSSLDRFLHWQSERKVLLSFLKFCVEIDKFELIWNMNLTDHFEDVPIIFVDLFLVKFLG